MALTVDKAGTISAPVADVWDVLGDLATWSSWFPWMWRVTSGVVASGVGATRRVWVGPLRFDERFDVWADREHLGFEVTELVPSGLVTAMREDWCLEEEAGSSTRVAYTISLEPTRGVRAAQPLTRSILRAVTAGGVAGLRRRVERATDRPRT